METDILWTAAQKPGPGRAWLSAASGGKGGATSHVTRSSVLFTSEYSNQKAKKINVHEE